MMPEDRSCAKEEKTAYAAWMAETVEPYLKEHGEKGYLKMEDGMSIAYRRYFLPDAGKCVVISHGFANSRKNITKSHTVFCRRDTRSMCRNTGDTGIPGARWMAQS